MRKEATASDGRQSARPTFCLPMHIRTAYTLEKNYPRIGECSGLPWNMDPGKAMRIINRIGFASPP